jgi:Baseplate J-like protein
MPIPPVPLDDLTWADLTAAARRRIPAASNSRWTLHAPVDPGVTLLELHAWLLEQRLYWMNQVPDAFTRGALGLLGERPCDAQYSRTVLHFSSPSTASSGIVRIPAGTLATLQDSNPPLVFSTTTAVTVLPLAQTEEVAAAGPAGTRVRIGGVDRFAELEAGRDICLFAHGADREVEISLALASKLTPASSQSDLSLLFVLRQPGVIAPEWSADAVSGVAPASPITWWYVGPGGTRKPFSPEQVSDGTCGLRRSGIVRFARHAWSATQADGVASYSVWLRAESGAFTSPPCLSAVWPNVLIAEHRRKLVARREVDWLPLPGNIIPLGSDKTPPFAAGARLRLKERDGRWHWWSSTADFSFHGPEDRVFVVDRDARTLLFGDGETGRIPLPGSWFSVRDLIAPVALALAWKTPPDPVSARLRGLLSPERRAVIDATGPQSKPTLPLRRALLEGLNRAVEDAQLYDAQRFEKIVLRDATRALLEGNLTDTTRKRRNRLLLEDAYPTSLAGGQVELHLALGGGTAGNVGALRAWDLEPAPQKGLRTINIVAATGGAEPEALGEARQRAAGGLRRIERAVTAADFELLARTTPGIAIHRAHAAVGFNPAFPCTPVPGAVTVFVVPNAPRDADKACPTVAAPQPDPGALAAVAARLDLARLIGTELYVRPPTYRPVALTVDVEADTAAPDALRTDLASALTRFLDPLTGGDQHGGWPFGGALTPSVLLRRAQDAIGDQGEVVRVGIRLLDVEHEEQSCEDVAIRPHELPALQRVTARVRVNQTASVGGLQ